MCCHIVFVFLLGLYFVIADCFRRRYSNCNGIVFRNLWHVERFTCYNDLGSSNIVFKTGRSLSHQGLSAYFVPPENIQKLLTVLPKNWFSNIVKGKRSDPICLNMEQNW